MAKSCAKSMVCSARSDRWTIQGGHIGPPLLEADKKKTQHRDAEDTEFGVFLAKKSSPFFSALSAPLWLTLISYFGCGFAAVCVLCGESRCSGFWLALPRGTLSPYPARFCVDPKKAARVAAARKCLAAACWRACGSLFPATECSAGASLVRRWRARRARAPARHTRAMIRA